MTAVRRRPVLVVGGGPVGMFLAADLARYGVPSLLVNTDRTTRWFPKGNTHNARTMEHYRRIGLSERVRAAGLPAEQPTDVCYFTRIAGYELGRIPMPSGADKLRARDEDPCDAQVVEPLHRSNQMYVERVLYDHVINERLIDVRFGYTCTTFVEHPDHVVAEIVDSSGRIEHVACDYLVGCDGGRSTVRELLGVRYGGQRAPGDGYMRGPMLSAYVRVKGFKEALEVRGRRMGWSHAVMRPGLRCGFINLNGDDEFRFSTNQHDAIGHDDALTQLIGDAVGAAVDVTILGRGEWTAALALVAESYGTSRVFLCGDSCHLFTPTGGLGMNTGIDDASNLAWKLAAVVQGWGGPRLLPTYERERRPIGVRNTTAARVLTDDLSGLVVPPEIEDEDPAGQAARDAIGRQLSGFDEEFASLGLQLGARYDGSPVIVADGTAPPADEPHLYRPTGCPGGRAPHVWIRDGRESGDSLFDSFGVGFALLSFGASVDVDAKIDAAHSRGVPVRHVPVDAALARALYGADFALIRPDQHVAWRGNRLPDDLDDVFATACGR